MTKGLITVGTGTLASRLLGFGRDALAAALLGAGPIGDAFLFSFQLVSVARRLLTEGALNAALVPAWLRIKTSLGEVAAAAFAGRILGTLGALLVLLTAIAGIAMPLIVPLLAPGFTDSQTLDFAISTCRLMLPYLAFAGPAAILIGLQNARGKFAVTAFAPVLFNVTLIAVMLTMLTLQTDSTTSALALSATVGGIGLLQLAMLLRSGERVQASPLRISFGSDVRKFARNAIPAAFTSSGPQLLTVLAAVLASNTSAAVSWLYFATRLIELPLGIISAAAGAIFVPEQARASQNNDAASQAQLRTNHLLHMLAVALPASAGLFMISQPVVELLFQRGAFTADDARATASVLAVLAIGLPAQTIVKALSPGFFARESTREPLLATLAGLLMVLPAGALLSAFFGVSGIAAAITLAGWTSALVLFAFSLRDSGHGFGKLERNRLASLLLSTAVMTFALWGASLVTQELPVLLQVSIAIAVGVAAYALSLLATGNLPMRAKSR